MDARYRCPKPIVALINVNVIVASLDVGPRCGPDRRSWPATSLRRICNSIWYQMRSGCQRKAVPATHELANGRTAHGWFARWTEAGRFALLHLVLVGLYVERGRARLRWLGIDCTLVPAPLECAGSGPNPAAPGKEGMNVSVVVDKTGVPLAGQVAEANTPDFKLLCETLAALAGPVLDGWARAGSDLSWSHTRAMTTTRPVTKQPSTISRHGSPSGVPPTGGRRRRCVECGPTRNALQLG